LGDASGMDQRITGDMSGLARTPPSVRFCLGNAWCQGSTSDWFFLTQKQSVLNHPAMDNEQGPQSRHQRSAEGGDDFVGGALSGLDGAVQVALEVD
jgi:hypothetical protein